MPPIGSTRARVLRLSRTSTLPGGVWWAESRFIGIGSPRGYHRAPPASRAFPVPPCCRSCRAGSHPAISPSHKMTPCLLLPLLRTQCRRAIDCARPDPSSAAIPRHLGEPSAYAAQRAPAPVRRYSARLLPNGRVAAFGALNRYHRNNRGKCRTCVLSCTPDVRIAF